MPILGIQIQGHAIGTGGVPVPVPSQHLLQQMGPKVQVTLAPSSQVAAGLVRRGIPVPAPVTGFALIDTGASLTCVDDAIAQGLMLPVVNVMQMASASHASHPANVYPVRLETVGFPFAVDVPMAMGAALQAQGLIALIGRDVLASCQLVYNGPMGQFTLAV